MTSKKRCGLLIMALAVLLIVSVIESYGNSVRATIEYQYDGVGNITEKKVTYTTTADPITINSGAAYTDSTNVILALGCTFPQCDLMKFSHDGNSYEDPEAYSTPMGRILTSGDGTKFVYVMFKEAGGTWSPAYNDTIVLDTTPPLNPTIPATETHGVQHDTWQRSVSDPDFTWSGASDGNGSGIKGYYWYFGTDPNGNPMNWRDTGDCNPAAVPSNIYYLRVKTEDHAGNQRSAATMFIFKYYVLIQHGHPLLILMEMRRPMWRFMMSPMAGGSFTIPLMGAMDSTRLGWEEVRAGSLSLETMMVMGRPM
jgi:hypothetical protein